MKNDKSGTRSDYAAEYVTHNTPDIMLAGQISTVQMTVLNPSSRTWLGAGTNPVRLGYRWYDLEGQEVPPAYWEDLRTSLFFDLGPGQQVVLNAQVSAPHVPGAYELRWDLVEEMVTWYSWQGVPTLNVPVSVRATRSVPSLKWQVTASHHNTQSGLESLLQAIDGNLSTRWSSQTPQQAGMWVQVDLGEVQRITQVRLNNALSPQDYPRSYRILLSSDDAPSSEGKIWTTVVENLHNPGYVDAVFPAQEAQFVKIELTQGDPNFWWSIHQIDILPYIQIGASASHNNILFGPDNLNYAVDGLPDTYWSTRTLQRPDMWFQIDLREPRLIHGLQLISTQTPGHYPRGYVVQISSDGQGWQPIVSRSENDRDIDLNFSPRLARYLQIQQTGSSDNVWWSIGQVMIKPDQSEITAIASHNNTVIGEDNLLGAFDMQPGTRWSTLSPQQPGMWFELDLGLPRILQGLSLDQGTSVNEYPRGYLVQLSVDRQAWTTVARQDHNTHPLDLNFEAQTARYLRIEQTGQDHAWWSIHEINLKYGTVIDRSPQILSEAGLDFVMRHEGLRLELYNDPAGHCTIGVGHLVHQGPCNGQASEAQFSRGISQEQAVALLRQDTQIAEQAVLRLVQVPLTQYQFDALVSFTFNVGQGNLAQSDLLQRLNQGQYEAVPEELMRWVYAGGQRLPGLERRRQEEGELFRDGVYG